MPSRRTPPKHGLVKWVDPFDPSRDVDFARVLVDGTVEPLPVLERSGRPLTEEERLFQQHAIRRLQAGEPPNSIAPSLMMEDYWRTWRAPRSTPRDPP